mmetsp:Transcript_22402/g.40374  ORF Transcript_22402/g.40374 Transcript_22402/m.40374 type:complete len:115 (+) Transcript_22402:338-682(+)
MASMSLVSHVVTPVWSQYSPQEFQSFLSECQEFQQSAFEVEIRQLAKASTGQVGWKMLHGMQLRRRCSQQLALAPASIHSCLASKAARIAWLCPLLVEETTRSALEPYLEERRA